ncbi:hypothetical protein [Streptomyces resistomycificus]|uniref:Uncharacterized protein n=1 Tax=Streptomyces resistomycificus TaxID=67356 RepID=A0A0L8LYI5_9ACTN|nr:hypothetical protein [Streptomyces resistomycificus]KOG43134.1 hypothetical protein ADK37_02480 [Streptomyces resistomycificus]KUN93164.1 hypothetical protein AQJ84_31190 [Streptomyces resistomycificus]
MTQPVRPTPTPIPRAVRHTGRVLCWSLALGMITAAVGATHLAPHAHWWHVAWPLPWYLTGASAVAWGVLRVHEKAGFAPPTEEEPPREWEQAA